MIIIDTSALVAIIAGEAEKAKFTNIMLSSSDVMISAVNYYETRVVLQRRFGVLVLDELDRILSDARVVIMSFDQDQAHRASSAYRGFGKGVHPAGLNLANCAAYALAKTFDCPLFYKGDDFAKTDIVSAARYQAAP